ncbi:serine hydrolase [Streptococcus loxodontisalivarius]|uniref:Beta-lactamase class C n=1 Tax=Streptococcus loxodontisalivarius TaxID=1349415 RepID=A0ABS2PPA7_9STRE|nr:serine hydrolase [Streptococcus loxodontisalivarius]MBM7641868.1 beta-lactamase class C [Streptococcus loxodontisalivarius]
MKKFLAMLMSLPLFLMPLHLADGEFPFSMTAEEIAKLKEQGITGLLSFETIPTNPNVYTDTLLYTDGNLTQPIAVLSPNKPFKIAELFLNNEGVAVFRLEDGRFLEASRMIVYDDLVFSRESISQDMWTGAEVTTYASPYISGVAKSSRQIPAYTHFTATEKATTTSGTYYKYSGYGWVHESQLSETDNRMEAVQTVLTQKYNKDNYSIYVKQLETGKTAGINQDQVMYSASISKLPILYYTQDMLDQGAISLSSQYQYIPEVNDFEGAYDPSGSGYISKTADGANYSVETLLKDVAQQSDNVASNMLAYYVTGQFDQTYQETIASAIGRSWDMQSREVSSETAGLMMEAIYKQNGTIISYLSQTDFDGSRISKNIDKTVAHKIGDAYDYKHDVAIVYTDSPFILSIFTDKASYDDITAIADDVYALLK